MRNVTRSVLQLLVVAVAAFAATTADAKPHHKIRLARGQPTQIPILDGDLGMSDVRNQFAMQQVRAPIAQAFAQGTGVTVAVVDGGFDLRHEFLAGHLASNGWDALETFGDAQDLGNGIDGDSDGIVDNIVGHGTFVASLILSVAPNAQILPVRVLDDEGWGTEQSVANGVYYAISHGAKVINMSLVVPDASHVLRDALKQAANMGIVVVGSAGNDSDMWYDDPMLASRVLAVGAVDSNDMLLPWSVTGPTVDCYAPGGMVIGALGGTTENSYAYWSGTSFSSPFAAGGAALLLSRSPWMMPQMVVSRLVSTVDPAIGVVPFTRGRVNLGRALAPLF